MKIRPLNDFVLIERSPKEEISDGGIVIPDNAKKPLSRGTVIATGRGTFLKSGALHEPDVKKGDLVIFADFSEQKLRALDDELVMVREDNIHCVLE